MADETPASDEDEATVIPEDHVIRDRVRLLTLRALKQGRLDPEGVKEVVRTVIGADAETAKSRQAFAAEIESLDRALEESVGATHDALRRLASRGTDYTDNDLKMALVSLKRLQEDYVAVTDCLAEATAGSLRDELIELTINAQNASADVGSRVATMLGEFTDRLGSASKENAATGLETARTYGVRMALLTSGILAGVGDALSSFSETDKKDE